MWDLVTLCAPPREELREQEKVTTCAVRACPG